MNLCRSLVLDGKSYKQLMKFSSGLIKKKAFSLRLQRSGTNLPPTRKGGEVITTTAADCGIYSRNATSGYRVIQVLSGILTGSVKTFPRIPAILFSSSNGLLRSLK